MKKFSFQAKLSLTFIALTLAALTLNTFFVYQKTVAGQKEELRAKNAGSQFDSRVVDALVAYINSDPAEVFSGKDARVVEWGGLENR